MATTYTAPWVYVEEVPSGAHPIRPVGISTAGFIGEAPDDAANAAAVVPVNNWTQFVNLFVGESKNYTPLYHAVNGYFLNGGSRCYVYNTGKGGALTDGLAAFDRVDPVAILVCPGQIGANAYEAILTHCEGRKDRVAILDLPQSVPNIDQLTRIAVADKKSSPSGDSGGGGGTAQPGLRPRASAYGACYFPWISVADPADPAKTVDVSPSGHMAGVWARSDATVGVHKAPANEIVRGATNITYALTRDEHGELNVAGVNCIRVIEGEGIKVWGARTLAGDDSEWRYLNVRRLFVMMEKSIQLATNWIVFEPNDRTLWNNIKRNAGAFLTLLWDQGALMGRTPSQAFFIKCDEETNPPEVIDQGMVVTVIGVAPVKPAEFVVFRISQWQGGSAVDSMGATA